MVAGCPNYLQDPVICNVVPNGDISCLIIQSRRNPRRLKTIEGDLDTSVMTVTGKTLRENLEGDILNLLCYPNPKIILNSVANGIQVLYGNRDGGRTG